MKNAWQTGLGLVTLAAMVVAVYMALVGAPTEAEQGMVQRIFYFHVPCAMVTFASFGLVAIAGALYLWLGSQIWDDLGYAAVEVGMVFCTLVLITGSIWAKPIWGAWWTWDSRLTTTFILWLIYGGYLLLRAFGGDTPQVARFAAVVGIIGALDVPIIVVSVRLWRTIHPAVLLTRQGEHGLQDPRMVAALLISMLAFTTLFIWLLSLRFKMLRVHSRLTGLKRDLALWRAAGEGGR
jgi:heme exporter protein C